MDLKQFANNLVIRDSIWYSKSKAAISYPEEGNENCFELEEKSFWFKHRNNCIIEVVKKNSDSGPLFDIGGGNGFVSMGLEKEKIETILVEPGEKGIINAQKRNLKNLVCSTLEDADFKQDSISNIGLFDVIEHIEKDVDFLKRIYFYLRPGGKIFITIPAYQFLWSDEDVNAGHFRRYTLINIQKKLKLAGFKIKYKTYIFSFLPLPIFLFRTLPGIIRFKKRKTNDINKHKQEHEENTGRLKQVLDFILNWELHRIKKEKKIPFGSSCLIIGLKV
jgi:SAM-dependent methyltransferase